MTITPMMMSLVPAARLPRRVSTCSLISESVRPRTRPLSISAEPEAPLESAPPIQPGPDAYREAIELLAGASRAGGAIYDALIALAARDADVELVSLDARAEPVYALCGVDARLLVTER